MDLSSSSHQPGRKHNIVLLGLASEKACNFVGVPYAVENGMVLNILQVPQKVSGDVWHHCDQILTYTSGVILGIERGFKKTGE